jgi:hypothetical protein
MSIDGITVSDGKGQENAHRPAQLRGPQVREQAPCSHAQRGVLRAKADSARAPICPPAVTEPNASG